MELIVFCGLQGAGKTTFYNAHFATTHVRVNLDMLKTRRRERLILDACLQGGQRCVIDNTNPTRDERAVYISAAKAHHFSVVGYHFDVNLEICRIRNAQRNGKSRVADRGLLATSRKLTVPSLDEGFARLFRVQDGTVLEECASEVR